MSKGPTAGEARHFKRIALSNAATYRRIADDIERDGRDGDELRRIADVWAARAQDPQGMV